MREANGLRCRILDIGADSGIHGPLKARLEAEELVSLQRITTEALAVRLLRQLRTSELPHIVVIRFRLPVTATLDLISQLKSASESEPVRIFIWGSDIPSHQIELMYEAGATCVLPGQFNLAYLETMRVVCHMCIQTDRLRNQPRQEITCSLIKSCEKDVRNVKLGTLFFWTGCTSVVLWVCSLALAASKTKVDLMPLPVYAALASAGISLSGGVRRRQPVDLAGGTSGHGRLY